MARTVRVSIGEARGAIFKRVGAVQFFNLFLRLDGFEQLILFVDLAHTLRCEECEIIFSAGLAYCVPAHFFLFNAVQGTKF